MCVMMAVSEVGTEYRTNSVFGDCIDLKMRMDHERLGMSVKGYLDVNYIHRFGRCH